MSHARIVTAVAIVSIALPLLAVLSAETLPLRATAGPAAVQASGQEDDVITVGGHIHPPRKTRHVSPVYPPDAVKARIQGAVVLKVLIGRNGKVRSAKVIKSIPELDAAALDAVLQWEYEPAYVRGKAVSVRMTVTINFSLP